NLAFSDLQKAELLNQCYAEVFKPPMGDISNIVNAPLRNDLDIFTFSSLSIPNWIRKMPNSTSINSDGFSIASLKMFLDVSGYDIAVFGSVVSEIFADRYSPLKLENCACF